MVDFAVAQEYLHPYARSAVLPPVFGAHVRKTKEIVMPNPVRAIPEGYHSITPGLTCKDAGRAMDFYKQIFGATEIMRMAGPDGKVMHGELRIGDSVIFVADEFPGMSCAPTPGAKARPRRVLRWRLHVLPEESECLLRGRKHTPSDEAEHSGRCVESAKRL